MREELKGAYYESVDEVKRLLSNKQLTLSEIQGRCQVPVPTRIVTDLVENGSIIRKEGKYKLLIH